MYPTLFTSNFNATMMELYNPFDNGLTEVRLTRISLFFLRVIFDRIVDYIDDDTSYFFFVGLRCHFYLLERLQKFEEDVLKFMNNEIVPL